MKITLLVMLRGWLRVCSTGAGELRFEYEGVKKDGLEKGAKVL